MSTIGIRVRQQRMKLRLSQIELSRLCGVSKNYLSEIESDKKNNITIQILCAFCKTLNVTPNDLIPKELYTEDNDGITYD